MPSCHIRKEDTVQVIAGKDRGKRGRVLRVMPRKNVAFVEGVNLVKRHTKPNPQLGVPGGIIEKEAPVQVSNVGLFNPITQKADRVGVRTLEDGRKVRFFKSNGEVVDA